jgi:endonuclease YncB( thermonuclease family)
MRIRLRALLLLAATATVILCWAAPASAFPDVPAGHRYALAIADLSGRGIINGYTDGTFGPDDPVTRQQFAKMICLTLGLVATQADVSPFPDVEPLGGADPLFPDHYVAKAALEDITTGYPDGTFRPYTTISRAQVVTMVVRAANSLHPGVLGIPPVDYVASWWRDLSGDHLQNARTAEINSLLVGLPLDAAASDPWASMPRGEVAQVLHDLLVRLAPPVTPPVPGRLVRVDEVLDGETVVVNEREGSWVIHLIGVDAPETGEPFARDARDTLEYLVGSTPVSLSYDVYDRDIYGRFQGYLWIEDVLINAELLAGGVAEYSPRVRPEPRQDDLLKRAAIEATRGLLGVYGQEPSAEDFFAQYPTDADIAEIDKDFTLVFEYDPTAGQPSGGSLTPLQKRVYQVLQFMRLLSFDEPGLPWTDLTLYYWFRDSVTAREIHFEDIEVSYFQDGVIHIAARPNTYLCLTDSFIDPDLGGGLMDTLALFVHEARHNQIGHWDGENDHTIAEMGSWGVQYHLYLYLADKSNFFVNDLARERLKLDAEMIRNGRFTDEPQ